MSKYFVKFTPEYSNKAKRVECEFIQEANALMEWFVKHNTPAEVILVEEKETVLETSAKGKASL